MRAIRNGAGRQPGIARNVHPRFRTVGGGTHGTVNPYQRLRAGRIALRDRFDTYRQFVRRVLQAA